MKLLRTDYLRQYSTSRCSQIIDWDYYSNPENLSCIAENVSSRKIHCELLDVLQNLKELHHSKGDPGKLASLKEALFPQLLWFPNTIHPNVLKNKSEKPVVVKKLGNKPDFSYFPTNFEHLCKRLNLLRTKHLGHTCGHKSYYLKGDLALLEHALVKFAVTKLINKKFELLYVPDILPKSCIEACGMKTNNVHSQVYHVHDNWAEDLCLSGTSEIAVANFLSSKIFDYKSLPLKFCAVSRCYRAEANKHQKEKGIFRVHQFTKVEMFGVTANETGEESEELLHEFIKIQEEIFLELGLYFKIIEMPPYELSLPAYHKYDMEAWIPTQKIFGEISSASNCTDYQSRRLNIRYFLSPSNEHKFCHTVNGTAAAIPRLLITILENCQNLDGSITIPEPLQKYFKKDVLKDKFNEIMLCTKLTK